MLSEMYNYRAKFLIEMIYAYITEFLPLHLQDNTDNLAFHSNAKEE